RPGWSRGRQISSDHGFTCIGNTQSDAVACFDEPRGDATNRDSAAVSAGYLGDETGGALPSFGRWPLRSDENEAWQADFSPDGTIFALSSAPTVGASETLWATPTARVGQIPAARVADDAPSWRISNDGKKVYFRRDQVDLAVTDFPGGGAPQRLESGILGFDFVGGRPQDQALWITKALGPDSAAFELVRDRSGAPPKTIFTYSDVLDGHPVSNDLRYTTWVDVDFRGIVFRNDDLTPCALDVPGETPVYEPAYLRGASLMFWMAEAPVNTHLRDGYYAAPERCRDRTQFAHDLGLMVPVGDRGLVFTDGAATGRATLKYVAVSADGAGLGAARTIQDDVGSRIVFVGAEPPLLVYTAGGATPGIFVYGPVPF
ncbi:MAG: hypothetical protein JWM82_2506, partial [Myxococcales bacterium]|nr:hypothetical protein [Myxococcales bacterium]